MMMTLRERASVAAACRHANDRAEQLRYWAHLDSRLKDFPALGEDILRRFYRVQRNAARAWPSPYRPSTVLKWLHAWRLARFGREA
jgi:hypothetical protein